MYTGESISILIANPLNLACLGVSLHTIGCVLMLGWDDWLSSLQWLSSVPSNGLRSADICICLTGTDKAAITSCASQEGCLDVQPHTDMAAMMEGSVFVWIFTDCYFIAYAYIIVLIYIFCNSLYGFAKMNRIWSQNHILLDDGQNWDFLLLRWTHWLT